MKTAIALIGGRGSAEPSGSPPEACPVKDGNLSDGLCRGASRQKDVEQCTP